MDMNRHNLPLSINFVTRLPWIFCHFQIILGITIRGCLVHHLEKEMKQERDTKLIKNIP